MEKWKKGAGAKVWGSEWVRAYLVEEQIISCWLE